MKTTEEKLNAFLSQYSEDEQERIIQYALDHVIPRMKRKAHTSQPKQDQDKPVAVVTGVYGGRFIVEPTNRAMVLPDNVALYTRPQHREWVGLTDDEILLAGYAGVSLKTVKWAEAKLKEKNCL